MIKKYSVILLILISVIGIPACSFIFQENKFENTVWKSHEQEGEQGEDVFVLNIYSRNRIKATYGNIKSEYLYYFENNQIKITNTKDYSQSVLKSDNGKLIADPRYFGIKIDDSVKTIFLYRVNENGKNRS